MNSRQAFMDNAEEQLELIGEWIRRERIGTGTIFRDSFSNDEIIA